MNKLSTAPHEGMGSKAEGAGFFGAEGWYCTAEGYAGLEARSTDFV